jgi:hypothetical protein
MHRVVKMMDDPGNREFASGWMDAWDTFGTSTWQKIKKRWDGKGRIKAAGEDMKTASAPWPPVMTGWAPNFQKFMKEFREELKEWGSKRGDSVWAAFYHALSGLDPRYHSLKGVLRALPNIERKLRLDDEEAEGVGRLIQVLGRQYRIAGEDMDLREQVKKLAAENPELRKHLVPILRKTAGCACDDEGIEAGRGHGEKGKGYGMTGPDVRGKGKWQPKPKGKCFYETGDEGDRCYVTENGGPGGQTKGPPTKTWKDYEDQRW